MTEPQRTPPAPAPSKLAGLLTRLYSAARMSPGSAQRRKLPNGLRVDMKYEGGTLHLQLSREGVPPSMNEWGTVLSHLGAKYQEPGRCFIQGGISF